MSRSESLHAPDLGVARILERSLRNWELGRIQRVERETPQTKSVEDFICISRLVGSGGGQIARIVAEKLSWSLFDREILQLMAGNDETRKHIYESMDERDLRWFEETTRSVLQSEFGRNDYFHQLCKTALGIARQGHAVFLGRAIDRVLPRDVGLRVRIVAPQDFCLRNFAERMKLPIDKARTEMKRIEKERAEFLERHFRVHPDEAGRFDLGINSATFSHEQAAEIILAALQQRTKAKQ